MAGYKSLQVAEALNRVSQQLKPQVTVGSIENSVYGKNTNTPSPLAETNKQIAQADQYYNTLYSKTASDYAQDAAVSLGKGIVSVPQAAAGLLDLGDAALSAVGTALTGGNVADIQTGRVTKALDDAGVRFKDTQQIMDGWYSEGTQKQMAQLAALPGMSTEKSFGENMSSLGQTAGYVLDNPSIALNTIIQSLPAMGAGGAIGRGAAAIAPRIAGAAGAVGEGTIMAGTAQANMDTNADGYTTAAQSLGALGIGVLGGAVGQLGSRIANRAGAEDIDNLAAGIPSQVPKKGFNSLATGTVTEAAEEAAQSSLENVIANIASGKDAIEGLNQDLVLGTFAGAGMGAAVNTGGSLKSAALDAVMTAAQKQAEKIKERVEQAAPEKSDLPTEELANPTSEKYNPAAAIIRESKGITPDSTAEEIQAVKTNMNKVLTDAETHLDGLVERKELLKGEEVLLKNIEGAKAAVENFAEIEPERAAKVQDVLDNILMPRLEMLNEIKAKTTLEEVEAAIGETEKKVSEARDMHSKLDANIQATQDTLANMTPDQKIFAAPTAYTAEEIEAVIQSPETTPEIKQSLRVLADAIVAQNAVKSIDEVNNQIVGKKFDPNYRSTPQYLEQFSAAVRNGSVPTQRNLMREIQAFEQSHVQKAELVQSGLEQAQAGTPVQIVRNENGSWEFKQGDFLKGEAARKNGAITIATPRQIAAVTKTNEYMQAEAKAIVATRAAMESMTQVQPSVQSEPTAPKVNAYQPMDFTTDDPFQSAMDSYNQDMRSTNEWQPNTRSIDPRSNQVLGESVNPTAGETVITAEAQPTPGSAPTANQSTGTPPETAGVVLTGKSKYLAKDQAKADKATKFIGQGSESSSTAQYAKDFGDRANSGTYTADDVVFISAEGNRNGRKPIDLDEIQKATSAGATILTDDATNRNRPYNVGEREVVKALEEAGYQEAEPGVWQPSQDLDNLKPDLSNTEIQFDESGVGSVVPTKDQAQSASVSEQSVSVATEAQASGPINISSKGTGLAKALTNPNNDYPITYLGKQYSSVEHAYQSNKSGSFDSDAYDAGMGKFKVAGKKGTDTANSLQLMTELLKAKLEQHPSLIEEIDNNGGEQFLKNATHNVAGDKFWESTGSNGFIKALTKAYSEVKASTEDTASAAPIDGDTQVENTDASYESTESLKDSVKKQREQEEAKAPNKRNLVKHGFNVKDTVLNTSPNFMSRFMNRNDNTEVALSLTGLESLTPKQKQVLKDFTGFAEKMRPVLTDLVAEKKGKTAKGNDYADFRYQDFNQFLLEDGTLPENVVTAVSAAMFTWIAENGSKTLNTEKEVAAMLFLDNVEHVPTDVFEQMTAIGEHQSLVSSSLGQKAASALGLKILGDVDPGRRAKMEMGLGTLAAIALVQQGYLERNVVSAQDFAAMMAKVKELNEDATDTDSTASDSSEGITAFLRPKVGADLKPIKKVDMVIKSASQTQGIVNKLFDVPSNNKLPSTEPVEKTPNTFNDMGSQLPTFAKETYEASQKNGYKMSAPAMTFLDKVSREDVKELFGYVKPNEDGESFPGMHKKFWKGQLAANEALERSLALIDAQRDHIGKDDQEFFFEHTIWTNQRSGYDSAFNLQANKVHRAVAGMSAHVTDVNVGEATHDDKGVTTAFGEFLMAVAMTAEEIPIDLPTVDKVTSKTYLAAFQEYLKRDHVQAGIESMAAILEGNKPSKEDLANVKALVKEFGMGPMSVRGVQALAQMYIAERDGESTFKSDIAFESDGVTNGPVITNVALATAVEDMLTAGGIFTDSSLKSVPQYKENGGEDIYEQLGKVMKDAWAKLKAEPSIKPRKLTAMLALDAIYPAFGERKGAKPITTTSNYGAGTPSIIRANGREVLNSLYKRLEKVKDSQSAKWLEEEVNAVLEYHDAFLEPKAGKFRIQDPLTTMLTPAQENAILKVSELTHGAAIKETLKTAMGDFQAVRDTLTNLGVTGFKVFDFVRNQAIEEARKNTDGVILDGKGNRQEDLSAKELNKVMKSIAKYTPSVVSGMGNNSTNGKQSSMPLMKQKTKWDGSSMSSQQFNFVGTWESKQGKGFSVRAAIKRNQVADPGVGGLALIIQSLDAFIAHSVLRAMPTQNFHDANASKVGDGKKMAKIQNEAFVDGLMTTHVNREFARAYMKPLQALVDNPGMISKNDLVQLLTKDGANYVSAVASVKDAYARDMKKLDNMKTWVNVNQYGTEGGHYEMTNAKRKQIDDAVAKLKKDMAKDLKQAEAIDAFILGKLGMKESNTKQDTKDQGLTTGTIPAADVIKMVKAGIQSHRDAGKKNIFTEFNDMVLDLVNQRMPSGLEVNIYRQGTFPENVNGEQQAIDGKHPAWYTKGKDGKPQINIMYTGQDLHAKLIVHELVHAITADAIQEVRDKPEANPKAKESLDKLDALYEHIKGLVAKDPNASEIVKYGVTNLDEFIATGFSYGEFIDYLNNHLAPPAVRGKNRIVTALRSFADNVLGLLNSFTGRKYSPKEATALEALILDTSEFLGRIDATNSGTQMNIFGAPQTARNKVSGYTSKQVFDSLNSNLNPQFKTHLSSLMATVSDQILGNTLLENNNGAWTMEQAWQEYIDAGKTETTETAVTAGFRMTEQETFAVESLYAAIKAGIKDKAMTQVYAEMDKAYKSARAKLKVEDFHEGDWSTATKDERMDAQDKYDFLFKLGPQNPEHLSRFVAMALGSEYVNGKLGFSIKNTESAPENTFQRLVEGANDLVNYVSGLMTNSAVAQTVNSKLDLLSKELAQIDNKHRNFAVSKVEQQVEKITDLADDVSNKIRDKVVELAKHENLANSRFTAVRFASHTTRLAAKGDLWTTLDVLKEASSYENPNQRLGILGEIVNEAANSDATKNKFEQLLRMTKLNNQMKENLRDATTKNVMSTFEENGAYLSKEDKHSLTNFLRIDTQSLLDHYSVADIAKMFSNGPYLHNEIKSLEKQLTGKDAQIMINRAKQLAKYMVTGKSSPGLASNAQLIVSGFNSGEVVDVSDARVMLIDQIATMYAIEYTSNVDKARLNSIFKRELKNKTNGVDTSLRFHRELSKVAREKLFADNPVSMIKGFVPEITNPNREVRIANNALEAKLLKDQFYKEVKPLTKDKRDPTQFTPTLFLTEEANIQRLVSGAVEVVSTNRKGTSVLLDPKQTANITQSIAKSFPTSPNYNPMHDPDVAMKPNYDTLGNVIGYSYEMAAEHRDSYLERNNDFSELLGAYAATNFNKQKVPEQNAKVIDALYDDYKTSFKENPRAYVNLGPNAKDPGLREMWAMLPQATRDHIRNTFAAEQVYGQGGMMVRQDLLLMLFGYRKYSLNQSFDKMNEARNMFEKLYVGIMKTLFEDNAKVRGVQIERSWQEAVRLLKDIIVIRNVKTMLFNTMSNGMLLMAHGISPTDIVRDSLTAIRAGTKYRKDMANLISIRQKQRAGVGDFNKLEQEALILEDSISRNPLKGFIEEGMMPTIVEDVDPEMDHYSYKTKMQEKIEGYTNKVPKSVRTAAKWAFVSPDTPIYQFLNNATQFSDFSAKYAMYKYYTEKAKDKLKHQEALQIASDNFINYDVPTAKGLQYLNDMGVVMFTKYNMRIQKALFQLLKKRPATAMAQALFINSFTNLESGIDPLIWFNLGNPLREGAFGLPSALDEPFPIKILSGM